jgi:hypothetical protein
MRERKREDECTSKASRHNYRLKPLDIDASNEYTSEFALLTFLLQETYLSRRSIEACSCTRPFPTIIISVLDIHDSQSCLTKNFPLKTKEVQGVDLIL